ncbi:MAG: carbohydrate binding domain-containing protein [Bacteroidaceae bacterium]|nr:carbohydrate binding domain-containing protein [Bacteroidaceae bacterium]
MKKLFKTMMLATIAAFCLASCEDVPAPFVEPEIPGGGNGSEENGLPFVSASLNTGFDVYTPTGNAWSLGNSYAKATGYNSADKTTATTITYLISPEINLGDAENVYVDFNYVIAYTNKLGLEAGHQVLVCTEYNSADPATSNWVKLPFAPKERSNTSSWDMYPANTMSIPAELLGKNIRIAFRYECNSEGASTWELTNLNVSTQPGGEVTPDTPETPSEDGGTWDKPYTVAQAIANQTGKEVWVHAYIVGSIPEGAASTVLSNMTFTADGAHYTNMCIADDPAETNYSKCAPVQLPSGSAARANLNLKENPAMLGKEVWLKGKATKYCGAPGLKEISKYSLTAPTSDDGGNTDEGGNDTPAEGAQGDGSLENPFNAAAAFNYTSALPADQATTEKFYIKGIVCESNKMDISTQYKNATFHISDDGSANGTQFYIFRTKGLNGADITSSDDVQVGDEVIVYASLVNYMGNTPETAQGGMIYSQKRNGVELGGSQGGDNEGGNEGEEGGEDTPDTPDTPTEGNLLSNGDFEAWDSNTPLNWKSASSAGNATLSQSTKAHGGSYAVSVGYASSANKRLAYKETTYAPGTYKFSFWAKGTNTDAGSKCQTRVGYVPMKADGTIDSSNYKYGDYATLSATEWTLVEHEFTLTEETTICLVVMSPKNSSYHTSQNILVDDASLVKVD